ncbi:MAG TPA: methyltransferase domain-containing protein [Gaiellaceae bacterium]|jgi:SAM-dependent methyltransferase
MFQKADAYENFMGRYSRRLAPEFARASGVDRGQRVLDVGCGTGALTSVLADIVGPGSVAAVDPSEPFASQCGDSVPGADVRVGPAEALPFGDGEFDRALAQLVFHFVDDPAKSVSEMARVTKPGGVVSACVWDMTGGMTMIGAYWAAVSETGVPGRSEVERFGGKPGELAGLWHDSGLRDVDDRAITVSSGYRDFDELWATFRAGVGPVGVHAESLEGDALDAVREEFRRRIGSPEGAFELSATAWFAAGTA